MTESNAKLKTNNNLNSDKRSSKLNKHLSLIDNKQNIKNLLFPNKNNIISNNKLVTISNDSKVNHGSCSTDNLNINSNNLLNQISATPRTNLEKIVESLNDISEEFEKLGNLKYKLKAQQIVKDVLNNKMYNYEEFKSNSNEEAKLLQFYSPEYEDIVEGDNLENVYIVENSNNINTSNKSSINNTNFNINISSPIINNKNLLNTNIKKYSIEEFGTNFDVFNISNEIGRKNLLIQVTRAAFNYKDLIKYIKCSYLDNYIEEIRKGYSCNSNVFYHNDYHAADVLQGVADIINRGKLDDIADLSNLQTLATLYASLIHDYKHPGFNNTYLINTKSDIAYTYNDKSCLENYHLSEAFKLLRYPDMNIFEKLDANDFKLLRKRVIEGVLATDMANHSKLVGIMTSRLYVHIKEKGSTKSLSELVNEKNDININEIQQDYINFIIHAIDIGHAAKPFDLEFKWAELVTKEFHNQGDNEKALNLPVSFLCDRYTANIPSSQISFIDGIVLPTFQLVEKLLPNISNYIELIIKSKEEWEKIKNKQLNNN